MKQTFGSVIFDTFIIYFLPLQTFEKILYSASLPCLSLLVSPALSGFPFEQNLGNKNKNTTNQPNNKSCKMSFNSLFLTLVNTLDLI